MPCCAHNAFVVDFGGAQAKGKGFTVVCSCTAATLHAAIQLNHMYDVFSRKQL